MFYSEFAYQLDHDEYTLTQGEGIFAFPADAPAGFAGRKIPARYTLTNHAIVIEGSARKLFRTEEKIWASTGVDQIKRSGYEPVAARKDRMAVIQCLGETLHLQFSSEEQAAAFVRAVWDLITGTSELERNVAAASRTAASLIGSFAAGAGSILQETGKGVLSGVLHASEKHDQKQKHLAQIEDLYRAGILSAEEYEAKKRELFRP